MIFLLAALLLVPLDVMADGNIAIPGGGGGRDLPSISAVMNGKNLSSSALFNTSCSFSSTSALSLAQQKSAIPSSKRTRSSFISMPSPRGGGVSSSGGASKQKLKKTKASKKSGKAFKPVLGGEECFLPVSSIAALTLSDVATAFRFAIESNRKGKQNGGGDNKKLLRCEKTDRTLTMMRSIEEAARKSRGDGVLPAATFPLDDGFLFDSNHDHSTSKRKKKTAHYEFLSSSGGYGDIDALQFCAAMRIFAEWRLVRQVPDGYRGYAVGMELGHKDVVQNVGKIEKAVHDWIQERRAAADDGEIRGPTLRELLHYELELQTHGEKLPKLRDPSAAMGLLWSRRQLQYQTSIFSNVMLIPHSFRDAKHAVSEAYSEVYENLHGWAVQKVFQVSFRAAPDAGLIFRHMNPEELERVKHRVKKGEIPCSSEEDEAEQEEEKEEDTEKHEMIQEEKEEKEKETRKMKQEMKKIAKKKERSEELKIKSSFGGRGLVKRIFRRKAKKYDDTSNIIQPSSFKSRLRATFTGSVRSHVPPTEAMRTSRIFGGIRRVFSSSTSSSAAATVAAVPPKVEQSNLVRGGSRKVKQELKEVTSSTVTDEKDEEKVKEGWKAKRQRIKKQKKEKKLNLSSDALEEYVTKQMELDARERIKVYLSVAKPLLSDLEGLFNELNMEDPTVV